MATYSQTRWWSRWEIMQQVLEKFGDVEPFLVENSQYYSKQAIGDPPWSTTITYPESGACSHSWCGSTRADKKHHFSLSRLYAKALSNSLVQVVVVACFTKHSFPLTECLGTRLLFSVLSLPEWFGRKLSLVGIIYCMGRAVDMCAYVSPNPGDGLNCYISRNSSLISDLFFKRWWKR